MRYFAGFDVGSSKTHTLIVDETGQAVGFGKAGAGNHQGVGYDGFASVLKESFAQAQSQSGVGKGQIVGAGFGVAGCDFPSEKDQHLFAISQLGLSCTVDVVNDGWNGLLAGATRGVGVNVTAGSSVNCRGRSRNGKEGRIVGNGFRFGEFGGALEIAARGLQMVSYAWIERIAPTALTQIYINATGAKNELDLLQGLSEEHYDFSPALAVRVIQAARDGDQAARDILDWAGEELGALAVAVARQIEMQEDEIEIIQSGSVFDGGELITTSMQAVVLASCPRAKLIRLDGPPAVGAVILGMEKANFDGYAVRDVMIRTAKEIVN